jgi:penicillin amidase
VPGWDPTFDWQGYVPFEELPHVKDPPTGAIGTSNTRIVGSEYPHQLTFDWEAPYRQQRIRELVLEHSDHDVESMRSAQLDVLSLAFAQLKPLMIAGARAAKDADIEVLDRLEAWDTTMRPEMAEPLIFTAWVRETVKGIWSDDMGPAFDRYFDAHATALIRVLQGRARARDWCDNRATPVRESCAIIVADALKAALADLEQRYGSDRTQWTWGSAHFAYGEHRPFGLLPLIGSYFNVTVPSPGGDDTLNRGKMQFGEEPPFANRHASSYRAIYDFADLNRSLYMQSTGQSGNPFSPFYRSFAERWATGEYIRILTSREEIAATALGTWRLEPH